MPTHLSQRNDHLLNDRDSIEESVKKEIVEFGEICGQMLNDPRYILLQKKYQGILSDTLRLMVWYEADGSDKFSSRIRHYQSQIKMLSSIVDIPKDFAALRTYP